MYAGDRYDRHPDRAAFVMGSTGETVSYAELERRTNRLAHLLRAEGLQRLDHYAIFMENNNRYLESSGAGERAGLYYTCSRHRLR
jgi:long-chain acyl-CoA synthetase